MVLGLPNVVDGSAEHFDVANMLHDLGVVMVTGDVIHRSGQTLQLLYMLEDLLVVISGLWRVDGRLQGLELTHNVVDLAVVVVLHHIVDWPQQFPHIVGDGRLVGIGVLVVINIMLEAEACHGGSIADNLTEGMLMACLHNGISLSSLKVKLRLQGLPTEFV